MKKLLLTVLLCCLVGGTIFAGGKKEPAVDNSLEELKARGEFVLGLDDSFPPLGLEKKKPTIS